MYQNILFDLDGTLTDPGIGITNSIMHALHKFNIEVQDRSELYKFIGPPLIHSFQNFYGFSEKDAKQCVIFFREYFSTKGIFENEVYPGIPKLLTTLVNDGRHLYIATSKPEPYARRIVEHFNLDSYFSFVGGSTMNETRTAKAEVITYVLKNAKINNLDSVVMIGDREHDIIGAKKAHISSIGVLYGYGNKKELTTAGADCIVENVSDIINVL